MENKKYFLVYPDLQKILESSNSLWEAIRKYTDEVYLIYSNLQNLKEWKEEDFHIAISLYEEFLKLLERYEESYRDLLNRETLGKNSQWSHFIKSFVEPLAQANSNISFDFSARFKSFISFIQKAITLLESLDLDKVKKFYDLQAMKVTVHSQAPKSFNEDYEGAVEECYQILNSLIDLLRNLGAEIISSAYIGEASERVSILYRSMIKDYIQNPKANGYKALHACFQRKIGKKQSFFEIQVNSQLMQFNCLDGGIWSHQNHKKSSKIELDIDFDKVIYKDFIYKKQRDRVLVMDSCGLITPKLLVKTKTFQNSI